MLQWLPGCVPTCLCTLYIFVILTLTCTVLFGDTMLIQSAVFNSVQAVQKNSRRVSMARNQKGDEVR